MGNQASQHPVMNICDGAHYFRVAVREPGAERFDGWVHQEGLKVKASAVTDQICERYVAEHGKDNVEVLSINFDAWDELAPNKVYVQVNKVTPVVCRRLVGDSKLSIDTFRLDIVPLQARGLPVSQRTKVKWCYQVEKPFTGHDQGRIEITSSVKEDLSPIENAIDSMEKRVDETDALLSREFLQGSVRTEVHEGPMSYAEAFLGDESDDQPVELVVRLSALMGDFIALTDRCLQLHGEVMDPSQKEWQEAACDAFQALKQRVQQCRHATQQRLTPRMKRRRSAPDAKVGTNASSLIPESGATTRDPNPPASAPAKWMAGVLFVVAAIIVYSRLTTPTH